MPSAAAATPSPPLRSIGQIVLLMQTVGPLYLYVPDSRSFEGRHGEYRDAESQFLLPGAPAWNLRPEPWWLDSTATWVARRLAKSAAHRTTATPSKLLAGDVVSWSIDGQPLIGRPSTVAMLDGDVFVEAQATYTSWRGAVLPQRSTPQSAATPGDLLLRESAHDSTRSR